MQTSNINPVNDAYPFTPGPWLSHENGEPNSFTVLTSDKKWRFHLLQNGEVSVAQQRHNIALIAATPDLLEAAQLALDALSIRGADQAPAIIALTKAIKKAYANK